MMKGKVLKVMILSFALALTFGLIPGCGSDSDAKRACEENDTAHVVFQNLKTELADIVIDGVRIGRDLDTCESVEQDLVAGIQHTVEFNRSSDGSPLCAPSNPSYPMCTYWTIKCGDEDCD